MITKIKKPLPGQIAFGSMCAACLFLVLYYSDYAIEYMTAGLNLCARTVIPSLFPFMVISELIVTSGVGEFVGRLLERPIGSLFGISGISACPVLMGTLCGFPIGAKTTVTLLDNGYITKKEASRLLSFCNNPSSAFLINAVGLSLYSSKKAGIVFYAVTILSAVLIGICGRFFSTTQKSGVCISARKIPGIETFTAAVSSSATGMLVVCAYVVFFSAIVGCLGHLLTNLGVSKFVCAIIYGVTEMSVGVSAASALGVNRAGVCLTAFILGWSGISVHFQVLSICTGRGISPKPYLLAKVIHGILNAVIVFFIYNISPDSFSPQDTGTSMEVSFILGEPWRQIIIGFFIVSVVVLIVRKIHKSTFCVIY